MMRIKELVFLSLFLFMTGCATVMVRPAKVTLLPEDKIYSIPPGTTIPLYIDHKPQLVSFADDHWKVASVEFLGKEAEKANKDAINNVDKEKRNGKIFAGGSSVLTALITIIWFVIKNRRNLNG